MNTKNTIVLFLGLCLTSLSVFAQKEATQWRLIEDGIEWKGEKLPYADNIEMAGRKVAGIIEYSVDTNRMVAVNRKIIFPQIHPFIKKTDSKWLKYRAYGKVDYGDELFAPRFFHEEKEIVLGKVKHIQIKGYLEIAHEPTAEGLSVVRQFYPSNKDELFVEKWILRNISDQPLTIKIAHTSMEQKKQVEGGQGYLRYSSNFPGEITFQANSGTKHFVRMEGKASSLFYKKQRGQQALNARVDFIKEVSEALVLETPDPVLNQLFQFSKIRASESIFDSKIGLIHSPGGGRYYCGIWANDQAEYAGPFFPYLGYSLGNESAANAYLKFAEEINPEYKTIRYAFELEGIVPAIYLDRGDAAMIAYGASQFALAYGDKETAQSLWPLIEWCLEYCHRKLNKEGVVESESDEMEGRIATGTANLSTSSLYYGALQHSADLAQSLGQSAKQITLYRKRTKALNKSIEAYFGAKVEGLDTYKYFKEHQYLRHWICLPLVVGIDNRKAATIEALFDRLWSINGVHVEKNSENEAVSKIFWDRGTLYALRGTFIAGATEESLEKLKEYSTERLLGSRVPYPVEAFPEGNMAHLSAESALYCRVFTEGLFGFYPTGLNRFKITPRLPKDWDTMALKNIKAFQQDFDVRISRKGKKLKVQINDNRTNKVLLEKTIKSGDSIDYLFN